MARLVVHRSMVLTALLALAAGGCARDGASPVVDDETAAGENGKSSPGDVSGPAAGEQTRAGRNESADNAASVESVDAWRPIVAGAQRDEIWMACSVNNAKIGYTHLVIEPAVDDGRACLRFQYDDELKLRRFDTETIIRTRLTSLETYHGRLFSFRSEMRAGAGTTIADGRVTEGQLQLRTTNEGKTQAQALPWLPEYGGFFADQMSLRRQPLRPGEGRRLQTLLPVMNVLGEVHLQATDWEAVELPTGSTRLLHVDVTTTVRTTQLRSVLWVDRQGVVHKLKDLQLGMVALLTTRDEAMRPGSGGGYDLGFDTVVRVNRPLRDPHHTRRVVYRAWLTTGDVQSLFVNCLSQRVQPSRAGGVELTVQAIRPDQPSSVADQRIDPPTEADLAASTMLQSDDPEVLKLAQSVAANESSPWTIAVALESLVKRKIRLKNYSTAMATAAEVARSLEGDCTEHAMLLAAVCRARRIPARVAIGLVYYSAANGFAYHMWTEVWIADRWVPLDATLGLGGIGAAHLKLADASLQGADALVELLPVVQALGRLRLEIESVD